MRRGQGTWRGRAVAALLLGLTTGAAGAAGTAAATMAAQDRKSGIAFTSPSTQAMQRDDMSNPGMLSVLDGEAIWDERVGAAGKACRDCHQRAPESMKGVAARYPAFDTTSQAPMDLQGRIQACRVRHQQATPLQAESPALLALVAHVSLQSRGMPIEPPDDRRLEPFRAQGQTLWNRRMGQLHFSCSQCHDLHWGARLGPALIPQGHPVGYPIYRLEWQALGSLQRRFRNCMSAARAEPFAYGAPEFIQLELFLAHRAKGMAMETPGVRP